MLYEPVHSSLQRSQQMVYPTQTTGELISASESVGIHKEVKDISQQRGNLDLFQQCKLLDNKVANN